MSLYKCEECGCVEHTTLGNYWSKFMKDDKRALCTACDPEIKEWHGVFEKQPAKGMLVSESGKLYSSPPNHEKIVGILGGEPPFTIEPLKGDKNGSKKKRG